MDLSQLTTDELRTLLTRVSKEIEQRREEEKSRLLKAIESLVREYGFTANEILREMNGGSKSRPSRDHAKYRHPEIPEFSWSGRGRQPRWVLAFLDNGGTIDQLRRKDD